MNTIIESADLSNSCSTVAPAAEIMQPAFVIPAVENVEQVDSSDGHNMKEEESKSLDAMCPKDDKSEEMDVNNKSDLDESNALSEDDDEKETKDFSDIECMDEVLNELCEEESSQTAKDDLASDNSDQSDLSLDDDNESLDDGFDIGSILDVVCDNEDEMCSKLDSIIRQKQLKVETPSTSLNENSNFVLKVSPKMTDRFEGTKSSNEDTLTDDESSTINFKLGDIDNFSNLSDKKSETSDQFDGLGKRTFSISDESIATKQLKLYEQLMQDADEFCDNYMEETRLVLQTLCDTVGLSFQPENLTKDATTDADSNLKLPETSAVCSSTSNDFRNEILKKHLPKLEAKMEMKWSDFNVDAQMNDFKCAMDCKDDKAIIKSPKPKDETFRANGESEVLMKKEEGDVVVKIDDAELATLIHSKVLDFVETKYRPLINTLEEDIETLTNDLNTYKLFTGSLRKTMKEIGSAQQEVFRSCNYYPKVETRTVGVSARMVPKVNIPATQLVQEINVPVQQVGLSSPPAANNTAIRVTSPRLTSQATVIQTVSRDVTPSTYVISSKPVTTTAGRQVIGFKKDVCVTGNTTTPPLKSPPIVNPPKTVANVVTVPLVSSVTPVLQQLPPRTPFTNVVRATVPHPPAGRMAYVVPRSAIPQLSRNISSLGQPVRAVLVSSGPPANPQNTILTTALAAPTTTPSSSHLMASQNQLPARFFKHPAPLPASRTYETNQNFKAVPPKPVLSIAKNLTGIALSWNLNLTSKHAKVAMYQLFAYQECPGPVSQFLWKKVGDIKALALPMACTLTQFVEGSRYHFTVRAIDVHQRLGPFSEATSILLCASKKPSK